MNKPYSIYAVTFHVHKYKHGDVTKRCGYAKQIQHKQNARAVISLQNKIIDE
jgi:hypothetical protein